MKRAVSFVLFGLGTAVLFGCPIYPSDRDHRVCIDGDCYECQGSYYDDDCSSWTCNSSSDCPSGYTCNSDHRCKLDNSSSSSSSGGTGDPACTKPSDCTSGNCGSDNKCHAGDCSTTGCPATFVCSLEAGSNGAPKCIPIGGGGNTSQCQKDSDCPTPVGSKCLTGKCVAPADQCADATQCAADSQCVQGACTPKCSDSKPCPSGYACDVAKGVCTNNPSPCTSSSQCTGGKQCVQEHCVDPCGPNGTCAPGLACLDNGCTPEEQPVFVCGADGAQDTCQPGSVCLRHSCYIGCDADAGAEQCKNADQFNQCKPVTTGTGTYSVCGSTSNLGTECDPTQNKNCNAPLICIDGYCK